MGVLILLVLLVIVFFAEKNVTPTSATKQRVFISLAVLLEIVAGMTGYAAGNQSAGNNCNGSIAISCLTWALAIAGILLAIINLYVAIKGKQRSPIIFASLFIIACFAGAALAWLLSVFCLTF